MSNFELKNLGNGRVKVSFIINFKMIAIILALIAGIFALYWGVIAIIALAKLLWSAKWWLIGAAAIAAIIWLLSKINWRGIEINVPKTNKSLAWLIGIVIAILLSFLLFRSCEKESAAETPSAIACVVTEERFISEHDWIMLDAYLDETFNVKYANCKKFAAYGENLSYNERVAAFDVESYSRDWGMLFPYFEGKNFSADQLAALKRYGLWAGLKGFEKSPVCQKLQKGEQICGSDLAKVYTDTGKERAYITKAAKERALRYSWVLMNIYDGNLTIEELLDCPVKSYESISIEKMYDAEGEYIFNEELKSALKKGNGPSTRKVLGL